MLRLIFVVCLIFSVMTSQVSASGKKDPVIACALSIVIPGGGQFYNEQPKKALIPIAGFVTFIGFYYSAVEDNDLIWDYDGDDDRAGIGALIYLGTQAYGIIDAYVSAKKINQQRQFGHLIEFEGEQTTLGVDPIAARNKLGTMLTLRW